MTFRLFVLLVLCATLGCSGSGSQSAETTTPSDELPSSTTLMPSAECPATDEVAAALAAEVATVLAPSQEGGLPEWDLTCTYEFAPNEGLLIWRRPSGADAAERLRRSEELDRQVPIAPPTEVVFDATATGYLMSARTPLPDGEFVFFAQGQERRGQNLCGTTFSTKSDRPETLDVLRVGIPLLLGRVCGDTLGH